ncbi:MAG: class I SAM-dependent methyltransferase [Alphaproteobacteria bacterium]|nr:class I SAM-dependent methyltransferase [Alphaproteobacteria bacterium]
MFENGYYEKIGAEIFDDIPDFWSKYVTHCSKYQICFLMGLIRGKGMKNILEIGTSNGVASLYMLKAMVEGGGTKNSDFKLRSIDIAKDDFIAKAVLSEASKTELESFELHKGRTAFDIENILPENTKLDLVFIDGGHSHPHPLFDLIYIIPYLHDESLVVLHDVMGLHLRPNAWGESFIFEGWTESKYQNYNIEGKHKETLGCIKIPKDPAALRENLLRIAKIPMRAAPWKWDDCRLGFDKTHLDRLCEFMKRHYTENLADEIYQALLKNYTTYMEEWLLRVHETRFIDHIYEKYWDFESRLLKLETPKKSWLGRIFNNPKKSHPDHL